MNLIWLLQKHTFIIRLWWAARRWFVNYITLSPRAVCMCVCVCYTALSTCYIMPKSILYRKSFYFLHRSCCVIDTLYDTVRHMSRVSGGRPPRADKRCVYLSHCVGAIPLFIYTDTSIYYDIFCSYICWKLECLAFLSDTNWLMHSRWFVSVANTLTK